MGLKGTSAALPHLQYVSKMAVTMTHCSRVHVHLFESLDNTENERKWKTPCALGQVPGVPCLPQFQVCLHSLEPCIPNNVPEWSFQRHGELMGSQSQSGHFRALQSSDSLSWNQGCELQLPGAAPQPFHSPKNTANKPATGGTATDIFRSRNA